MDSRPGDSDVEQPAFLLDRLAVRAVRECVGDGQRAVGDTDEEHRVPLQPLGRVQGGQRHALHHRGWRASARWRNSASSARRSNVGPRGDLLVDQLGQRGRAPPSVPGLGARRRLGGQAQRARASSRTSGGSSWPSAAPRSARALQGQQRLPDLLAAEEALATADLERDARRR